MKLKLIKIKNPENVDINEVKCGRCGNNEGTIEYHSCSYDCKIIDDCNDNCNCCSECESDCAGDI